MMMDVHQIWETNCVLKNRLSKGYHISFPSKCLPSLLKSGFASSSGLEFSSSSVQHLLELFLGAFSEYSSFLLCFID